MHFFIFLSSSASEATSSIRYSSTAFHPLFALSAIRICLFLVSNFLIAALIYFLDCFSAVFFAAWDQLTNSNWSLLDAYLNFFPLRLFDGSSFSVDNLFYFLFSWTVCFVTRDSLLRSLVLALDSLLVAVLVCRRISRFRFWASAAVAAATSSFCLYLYARRFAVNIVFSLWGHRCNLWVNEGLNS